MHTFGALTGAQAVQMVKAGLKAIYCSGWQVAADANLAGQTYPDQSLYPSNSLPALVGRLNNALTRADQLHQIEGKADSLLVRADRCRRRSRIWRRASRIRTHDSHESKAGAAGVHYEDQLAAEKKCGHLGGKVLVPTSQHIRTLTAARLAADVTDVPTVLISRTDALSGSLLTTDVDPRDRKFTTGERHAGGVLPGAEWGRSGRRAELGLRTVRGHALVRNVQRPTLTRRPRSPRPSTPSSQASYWRTTAHPPSIGSDTSRMLRSHVFSESSEPWDTSSSSSRLPAGT